MRSVRSEPGEGRTRYFVLTEELDARMAEQSTTATMPRRRERSRVLIHLIPALIIVVAGVGFLWRSGLWQAAFPHQAATRKGDSMAQERVHAPELEGGVAWLNTDRPLTLAALKGKVVLLDFWTYCCINCMHIIPDLKKLEAKYPTQLVVIGVHSAKFPNERSPTISARPFCATRSSTRW